MGDDDSERVIVTWKENLCSPICPLREIMKGMDATGVPIALVVDPSNRLLGTVTDGDIRRHLLRGGNLDATAEDVMQPSPRVEYVDGPNQPLPDWVTLIPQVEYLSRKIVGLKDLRKSRQNNLVVIMAGGLGTRLKPLTDDTPKPMLHVGGKPILQRLVEQFVAQGFTEIYISVGYKAEVIKNYFVDNPCGANIKFLEEDRARGTAGALALLPKTHQPVVVANGDLITDVDFRKMLEFHNENGAAATMAVREYKMKCEYGFVQTDGAKVASLIEKPHLGLNVNAGIYVIGSQAMRVVPQSDSFHQASVQQAYLGNTEYRFDMTHLFNACIGRMTVMAFPLHELWLDVGTPETLAQAQRECGG